MTPLAAPAAPETDLPASVRAKLDNSTAPLKLAEVVKGFKRPKNVKAPDFQQEIRKLLDEEVRLGRAFAYPSGAKEETRYWSRDEKQLVRERAVELAQTPQTLPKLKAALAKNSNKANGAFLEATLREMLAEDRLFAHPGAGKTGPRLGAFPLPPPLPALAQAKHQAALTRLIVACEKLLKTTGATTDELVLTLRDRIGQPQPSHFGVKTGTQTTSLPTPEAHATPAAQETLEDLILKSVANEPVVSLADLRREMPAEFRGYAFDETVLRLARDRRVILSQDADPSRFSEAERADYVQLEGALFTTVSKWS